MYIEKVPSDRIKTKYSNAIQIYLNTPSEIGGYFVSAPVR